MRGSSWPRADFAPDDVEQFGEAVERVRVQLAVGVAGLVCLGAQGGRAGSQVVGVGAVLVEALRCVTARAHLGRVAWFAHMFDRLLGAS